MVFGYNYLFRSVILLWSFCNWFEGCKLNLSKTRVWVIKLSERKNSSYLWFFKSSLCKSFDCFWKFFRVDHVQKHKLFSKVVWTLGHWSRLNGLGRSRIILRYDISIFISFKFVIYLDFATYFFVFSLFYYPVVPSLLYSIY